MILLKQLLYGVFNTENSSVLNSRINKIYLEAKNQIPSSVLITRDAVEKPRVMIKLSIPTQWELCHQGM